MIATLSLSRIALPLDVRSVRVAPRPRGARVARCPDARHFEGATSMATPGQDLIAAVNADDAARVAELVAADPALASARDAAGVSALMLSRYRFDRATTDALLAADPELDVFEATALGYIDRLRDRLEEDPGRRGAYSADGFTALHFAGFFGKPEAARVLHRGGGRGERLHDATTFASPAAPQRGGRAPHRGLPRAARGRGRRERHASTAGFTPLHEAAQNGDVELVELFLSAGADPSRRSDGARRRRRSPRPPATSTWRGGSARSPRRADRRAPGRASRVSRVRGSARAPTDGRPSRTSPARPGRR